MKETQEGCLSFSIKVFLHFLSAEKLAAACRKDFFDELKRPLSRSFLFSFTFRVGRFFIGPAQQIVHAGAEIIRQPVRQFQRKGPLSPLIFGVQALVTQHIFRHLLLFQIPVLPQFPDTKLHNITRVRYILVHIVLLHYWTICPKIFKRWLKCQTIKRCI